MIIFVLKCANKMNLAELKEKEKAIITKIVGKGTYRKRIMEMGFTPGSDVVVVRKAPLKDPVEYEIRGSRVALRNIDASGIEVLQIDNAKEFSEEEALTLENTDISTPNIKKQIVIALIGNPNTGKTTIFNAITGKKERVANYSGVTIEQLKQEFTYQGYSMAIYDLPGVYSLTTMSESDESIRKFLREIQPDIIVNTLDASNLERNLYLTTDLIDMDTRMVIALNMMDEFNRSNKKLDIANLGILLGFPIVPLISKENKGIKLLLQKIIAVYEDKEVGVRHIHINYGSFVEEAIVKLQAEIKKVCSADFIRLYSSRFISIKLIEKDVDTIQLLSIRDDFESVKSYADNIIVQIEKEFGVDSEEVITSKKQGFIVGALRETLKLPALSVEERNSIADRILTHRYWGIPIFIVFLWMMFYVTFQLGQYPMGWIQWGVDSFSSLVGNSLSEGMLKDLLVDGILSGVGGVLIFLPNILLLYFFIALMEGSGYMSRAVFILDKSMHRIGLHGKSFIPLVMGFGCNVPAIMATRILENRNERMITMLINPFISCNARLPVYLLMTAAFFPHLSATILFSIYLLGVLLAILTAVILRKTIFKTTEMPFVMELPPYRTPSVSSLVSYMWDRAKEYLKKIAGVILIASIIFWSLSYFPKNSVRTSQLKKEQVAEIASIDSLIVSNATVNLDSLQKLKLDVNKNYTLLQKSYQCEDSYLGQFGKFIEPTIKPLGFDWKMGIGLLSGLTAKEIIVSTLAVLYHADEDSQEGESFSQRLQSQRVVEGPRKGEPVFTPLIAFVFMIFVSIYFPCVGSIIAISRESGSAKWGAFSVVYTLVLAWVISFLFYNIGLLFGL